MGWVALTIAVGAAVAVAVPGSGMYLAMGLGIAAIGAGFVGYRRVGAPGWMRLAGSGAMALGTVALALGVAKFGLTSAALQHLGSMFAQ